MTEEAKEESTKMKKKKLWWEIWLDRLKVFSLAGVMGATSTVMWKAWDAAEMFKSAHAQVKKNTEDIATLDAGMATEVAKLRQDMKADKTEMRNLIDKNKTDQDRWNTEMYQMQIQILKEIKKL